MSGLRELAAQATPGPWVVDGPFIGPPSDDADATYALYLYHPKDDDADVRLGALAPEMAALLADAIDWIEAECYGDDEGGALLARYDALNQKASGEEAAQ